MDDQRFDCLARAIAGARTRRELLKRIGVALGIGAGVLAPLEGALYTRRGAQAIPPDGWPPPACKEIGQSCPTGGPKCCSGLTCDPTTTRCVGPTPTPAPTKATGWSKPKHRPTNTSTNTPVPPTDTPTTAPTDTPTNTPVPSTNTPTNIPTNTPTTVPTQTPTNTATACLPSGFPCTSNVACCTGICGFGVCCLASGACTSDWQCCSRICDLGFCG